MDINKPLRQTIFNFTQILANETCIYGQIGRSHGIPQFYITLLLFYNFWGITQYFCESYIQKNEFYFEFYRLYTYIIYNNCESKLIGCESILIGIGI